MECYNDLCVEWNDDTCILNKISISELELYE